MFQKIIEQHSFFDKIFPHPRATIRITTVLNNKGQISSKAAYLRLGRDNNKSVLKHVQCSNEIKIAIDLDTGALFSYGFTADWQEVKSHPDTNIQFKDLIVPNFKKACKEVETLHSHYPFIKCIGWDISINSNEDMEIMEWNAAHNDIKFSEAVHGPNFTDLFSYINEKSL